MDNRSITNTALFVVLVLVPAFVGMALLSIVAGG